MHKQLNYSFAFSIIILNLFLLCESSRKIRYHKASSIQRKADPQIPSNFVGFDEGGGIFEFLAYYTPDDDNISRSGQTEEYLDDYEYYEDDFLIEYDDPVPSTTPRYITSQAPLRSRPATVSLSYTFYSNLIRALIKLFQIIHI